MEEGALPGYRRVPTATFEPETGVPKPGTRNPEPKTQRVEREVERFRENSADFMDKNFEKSRICTKT